MRNYTPDDFARVRDFLVKSYNVFPSNWTIERLNFSISLARIMNGVSLGEWESRIAIWESDNNIIGIVNSEGENNGEAFFQLLPNLKGHIFEEMLDFCEKYLYVKKNNNKFLQLHIPVDEPRLQDLVAKNGFSRSDKADYIAELIIPPTTLDEYLPNGFCYRIGSEITVEQKGLAHARAFGYENTEYVKKSPIGYYEMEKTPDYNPQLDIYVLSPDGDIASFATMWYDTVNKIGILEPVGTSPEFRKLGLARSSIYHLINKIKLLGAKKANVGSSQDFYKKIGFEAKPIYIIWEKEF